MKRKLLLGLLPILMSLSACNGAEANVKDPELYTETTEVSRDLFGDSGTAIELKNRRNESSADLTTPLVYVQYKNQGDGKYAIRFIGAIATLNVRAYWTRGLAKIDGNQSKALTGGIESTKAYSSIKKNDGTSVTASGLTGSEDYNYLVIYSMYNIPSSELDSYMIAYLTLEDNEATPKTVTSDAKLSQIKSDGVVFCAPSDATYFLGGDFVNNGDAIEADETILPEVNNASFNYSFAANDVFNVFENDLTNNTFKIYGYSKLGGADAGSRFANDEDSGKINVTAAGTYNLYLRKTTNKIYSSIDRFYLAGVIAGDSYWGNNYSPYEFYESSVDGEYVLTTNSIALNTNDKIKVHSKNNNWYPEGEGTELNITSGGNHDIHFFPVAPAERPIITDAIWESNSLFYVKPARQNVTINVTTDDVLGQNEAIYAVGDFNSWELDEAFKMTYDNAHSCYTLNTQLLPSTSHEFKFVKSEAENPTTKRWEARVSNRTVAVDYSTVVDNEEDLTFDYTLNAYLTATHWGGQSNTIDWLINGNYTLVAYCYDKPDGSAINIKTYTPVFEEYEIENYKAHFSIEVDDWPTYMILCFCNKNYTPAVDSWPGHVEYQTEGGEAESSTIKTGGENHYCDIVVVE